jgi:hypothetical protein
LDETVHMLTWKKMGDLVHRWSELKCCAGVLDEEEVGGVFRSASHHHWGEIAREGHHSGSAGDLVWALILLCVQAYGQFDSFWGHREQHLFSGGLEAGEVSLPR